MAPSPTIGFRVPELVKEALERAAAEDNRTVSQYVSLAITEHLREKGFLTRD
jgi:predicted HicB family RNase H-like nuclease